MNPLWYNYPASLIFPIPVPITIGTRLPFPVFPYLVVYQNNNTMFIVVGHEISNPGEFWASAQKNLPNLPEGGVKRVINVFPNETMDHATCVWEADSIEALDGYLREKVGESSKESYYQVNEANAMGLMK
jgi:hypothetical protein